MARSIDMRRTLTEHKIAFDTETKFGFTGMGNPDALLGGIPVYKSEFAPLEHTRHLDTDDEGIEEITVRAPTLCTYVFGIFIVHPERWDLFLSAMTRGELER